MRWGFEYDRPAHYGDGHLLISGYRWLLSVYVLGFHFMLGRRDG